MIGRPRGTRTSSVVSFDSRLTFLSTTSTFVLVALFSSRLLEYQWAQQCTFLTFVGWSPPSYLRLRFHGHSKQWNRTLQKPSSSATPFGTWTIFFSITEQCGLWKVHQSQFPLRNWNFSPDTSTSSTEVCYLDTNNKTGDINTPFGSVSASKRTEMTLHPGSSTFLKWTATFPPIQLTVFI